MAKRWVFLEDKCIYIYLFITEVICVFTATIWILQYINLNLITDKISQVGNCLLRWLENNTGSFFIYMFKEATKKQFNEIQTEKTPLQLPASYLQFRIIHFFNHVLVKATLQSNTATSCNNIISHIEVKQQL